MSRLLALAATAALAGVACTPARPTPRFEADFVNDLMVVGRLDGTLSGRWAASGEAMPLPSVRVRAVAGEGETVCAVTEAGPVRCWHLDARDRGDPLVLVAMPVPAGWADARAIGLDRGMITVRLAGGAVEVWDLIAPPRALPGGPFAAIRGAGCGQRVADDRWVCLPTR